MHLESIMDYRLEDAAICSAPGHVLSLCQLSSEILSRISCPDEKPAFALEANELRGSVCV